MNEKIVHCLHCQSLNFTGKKYCHNCDFRLPLPEGNTRAKRFYELNSVAITILLIAFVALLLVAMTMHW